MKFLILGGTGTIGSAVVQKLLHDGKRVEVLTRSPERAAALPSGAEGVIGDLLDPTTIEGIFDGVDRLFLLNAMAPTELHEGLTAVGEARRGGVRRIVYISVQDLERGAHLPHFASKIAIERAIHDSGIPYTILRPGHFYQNDWWFKEAILEHGIYSQPIGGVGVSRVDVRDIADAAVNALTRDGHENTTYEIVGPEPLSGEACAAMYSAALGREVRYGGDDLDAWEQQMLRMVPPWMVYDMKLMYAMFQEQGLAATAEQVARTAEIVGAPPRRFADFVTGVTEIWLSGEP